MEKWIGVFGPPSDIFRLSIKEALHQRQGQVRKKTQKKGSNISLEPLNFLGGSEGGT